MCLCSCTPCEGIHAQVTFQGVGAVGAEGVGHALDACKFLSIAVSGGSTGACGVGV